MSDAIEKITSGFADRLKKIIAIQSKNCTNYSFIEDKELEETYKDKLGRWTNEKNLPDFYELARLCKLTNVSSDYFIFGEERESSKEVLQELQIIEEVGLKEYKDRKKFNGEANRKKTAAETIELFNEIIESNFPVFFELFSLTETEESEDEEKKIFFNSLTELKEKYAEKNDFYDKLNEELKNSKDIGALNRKMIGKRIATLRRKKGETQKKFGKKSGIGPSIASIETGARKLKVDVINDFLIDEKLSKKFVEFGGIHNVSTDEDFELMINELVHIENLNTAEVRKEAKKVVEKFVEGMKNPKLTNLKDYIEINKDILLNVDVNDL